jgi:biotin synthase
VRDAQTILERLYAGMPEVPISLLSNPTLLNREFLERYKAIPVDRLAIAVDGATEEIFERLRGRGVRGPHRWGHYWRIFDEALEVFGCDRVGVHLIVGLGETEEEMIRLIGRIRSAGGSTHLFSFFPERGSRLAGHPQPPAGQYRRVQLARYLIDEDLSSADNFRFNENGQLVSYGITGDALDRVIAAAVPFMTSGCPDDTGCVACNRPFGDCTPGDDIRSFPFLPDHDDLTLIRTQLEDYGGPVNGPAPSGSVA